jgi:5-methylcytosine-specific restriction enzyme A
MPGKPQTFRPQHQIRAAIQSRKDFDTRRRHELEYRAWYKLPIWQSSRVAQLARQPLCETCLKRGEVTAATVVHHKEAHKGDWQKFIDPANHESACKPCHDGELQREERRGGRGVEISGARGPGPQG